MTMMRGLQRQPVTLKTWQYQTIDPWFRINRWHTLSSYRHEVCRAEPTAPRDYLDIVLKAEYDHNREWLKSKAEVLRQRDTLNMPHESVYYNVYISRLCYDVSVRPSVCL